MEEWLLQTGAAIRDGEDFFGQSVILVARVSSQAQSSKLPLQGAAKSTRSVTDGKWT